MTNIATPKPKRISQRELFIEFTDADEPDITLSVPQVSSIDVSLSLSTQIIGRMSKTLSNSLYKMRKATQGG